MAAYNFYIEKYPTKSHPARWGRVNIETRFNCEYSQFTEVSFNGDIKNIYTEDFAEKSGEDVYISDELAFKSFECKLTLLFRKSTCQNDVRSFMDYIYGNKIEYNDTFRKRYLTLLMTTKPNIKQEKLYGDEPYMLVEFTFKNILGQSFSSSQIK